MLDPHLYVLFLTAALALTLTPGTSPSSSSFHPHWVRHRCSSTWRRA